MKYRKKKGRNEQKISDCLVENKPKSLEPEQKLRQDGVKGRGFTCLCSANDNYLIISRCRRDTGRIQSRGIDLL